MLFVHCGLTLVTQPAQLFELWHNQPVFISLFCIWRVNVEFSSAEGILGTDCQCQLRLSCGVCHQLHSFLSQVLALSLHLHLISSIHFTTPHFFLFPDLCWNVWERAALSKLNNENQSEKRMKCYEEILNSSSTVSSNIPTGGWGHCSYWSLKKCPCRICCFSRASCWWVWQGSVASEKLLFS